MRCSLLHYRLSTTSRTHSSTILPVFQKPLRLDVIWPLTTAPVRTWFSNAASLARQEIYRCHLRIHYLLLATNVARIVVPVTLHPRIAQSFTTDCLCPTARRGRLARQRSSSCLMHSSHHCSHAKHFRVATWPHSSSSRSIRSIFYVFSESLDHTLKWSICTWLVHIRCSTALHLKCHSVLSPWYYVRLLRCILHKDGIIDSAYTYRTSHETLFSAGLSSRS